MKTFVLFNLNQNKTAYMETIVLLNDISVDRWTVKSTTIKRVVWQVKMRTGVEFE